MLLAFRLPLVHAGFVIAVECHCYEQSPRVKNGPAPAGCAATTTTDALARDVTSLPNQLWCSVTWDRGKEISDHARFTIDSGIKVFFVDPNKPWLRGTEEKTRLCK